MNYYDIMASMPNLSMRSPPPMSPEAFVRSCEGRMPSGDACEFAEFTSGHYAQCSTSFARRWATFEQTLIQKLAGYRAKQWKLEADAYAFLPDAGSDETYIDHVIAEAYAKSNPRERERVLDRARWQELDNLIIQTPFGLAAVLATYVKLQIMSRWYGLHRDKGKQRLQAVMDAILPDTLEVSS